MRKLHVKFPRLGNFINIDFQLCKDIITGIDNHTVQQWVQIVSQRTFLFINILSWESQVETFLHFLWEYFIKILWLCSCLKTWITPSEIFIFKRKYTSICFRWRYIINTDLCRLGGTLFAILHYGGISKIWLKHRAQCKRLCKNMFKRASKYILELNKIAAKGRSNCSGKLEWAQSYMSQVL